jgi:hypothetical protein
MADLDNILAAVRAGEPDALKAWADNLEEHGDTLAAGAVRLVGQLPELVRPDPYLSAAGPRFEAVFWGGFAGMTGNWRPPRRRRTAWDRDLLLRPHRKRPDAGEMMLAMRTVFCKGEVLWPMWEHLARRWNLGLVAVAEPSTRRGTTTLTYYDLDEDETLSAYSVFYAVLVNLRQAGDYEGDEDYDEYE